MPKPLPIEKPPEPEIVPRKDPEPRRPPLGAPEPEVDPSTPNPSGPVPITPPEPSIDPTPNKDKPAEERPTIKP